MAEPTEDHYVKGIDSITKTEVDYTIKYSSGEVAKLNILNDHVFRFYVSPTGVFLKYPVPHNPDDKATIVVKDTPDYDQAPFEASCSQENDTKHIIETKEIEIIFCKLSTNIGVFDKRTKKMALEESLPISYSSSHSKQVLRQNQDEFYFGGGMQNGRFTHKGEVIDIVNTNQWEDGGVTSPCPFFWSSYGFGVLRNTWKRGTYDLGIKHKDLIETVHSENYFDAFYFINLKPEDILSDYYELTGKPLMMPEYAFYEAHLNTFNRDYWVETNCSEHSAIKFEDGKFYKKFNPNEKPCEKGTSESLNGEKNNYQFSARAMIDRYNKHDMPLGLFIPNDGYGSGYGQTTSFEGDLDNLKKFVEYAHDHGVEVGLWTDSQLQPKIPSNPQKGERDLRREVGVGSVALKCDGSLIGHGYSFSLNAVENATKLFEQQAGCSLRPFIIIVDGWAGTQRYSGIWSGNQNGGQWENIRFHIPTFIGAGLSGIPIVGSDMDGIFGGGVKEIQVRDYQWKAFTPVQLNMDGWGAVPKNPFNYDDEAKNIIRAYLKLKSSFLPYNYTIGYESTQRLPMVRAMFLEFPKETPAYTKDSEYQYMWGPSILVAPVYEKLLNSKGVSIRKNVYLPDPEQIWIDMFTGEKYQGGKIYDNIEVPLWKIPVFIRDGAILPMVHCNNNPNEIERNSRIFQIYPNGKSSFEIYEDDGRSLKYLCGGSCRTKVCVKAPVSNETGHLTMYIHKTSGQYSNMVKDRTTIIRMMASAHSDVKVAINGETINIKKVKTKCEFDAKDNVTYYDEEFQINSHFKDVSNDLKFQRFLLIKIGEVDIYKSEIVLKICGYSNESRVFGKNIESLNEPAKSTSCSVTEETKEHSNKHSISVVPTQPNQDDSNLTKLQNKPQNTTNWNKRNCQDNKTRQFITLKFDLHDVYLIDKVQYIPRDDAGNGTFLRIRFRYSVDGIEWSAFSNDIAFEWNCQPKILDINHQIRYFEIDVLEAVGGFGSGKSVIFYRRSTKKEGPITFPMSEVSVVCNFPCQPNQGVCNLTKLNSPNIWHTDWNKPGCVDSKTGQFITLKFDLHDMYLIEKVQYIPRDDASNGTFLRVRFRYSVDDIEWSAFSDDISLEWNCQPKVLNIKDVLIRYFQIDVLDAVGGFGSGKRVIFYRRSNKTEEPIIIPTAGVSVVCTCPSQPNSDVCNLTKINSPNIWHTDWNKPGCVDSKTCQFITLKFDLHDVYPIEKVQYMPRDDAGNGTFLRIRFRYSVDGIQWNCSSRDVTFEMNCQPKVLDINHQIRYFEIDVLDAVGGFGSGKSVIFYRRSTKKEGPITFPMSEVSVDCNFPCQPNQDVCNLTKLNSPNIWHTDWNKPGCVDSKTGKFITLKFDLHDMYLIEKVQYIPRDDASNGTFLRVRFRYSVDDIEWSAFSDDISLEWNCQPKVLNIKDIVLIRYFQIDVLDAVGGFGSGKRVIFYGKSEKVEHPLIIPTEGVSVVCNLPSQRNQDVCNLTKLNSNNIWHTDWNNPVADLKSST